MKSSTLNGFIALFLSAAAACAQQATSAPTSSVVTMGSTRDQLCWRTGLGPFHILRRQSPSPTLAETWNVVRLSRRSPVS